MILLNHNQAARVLPLLLVLLSCGVLEKLANRDPIIDGISVDRYTVFVGDTVVVAVNASDPDKDNLVYSWSSAGGVFINAHSESTLWISPKIEDVYDLVVSVKDENGGVAESNVTITVLSRNEPRIRITQPKEGEFIVALGTIEISAEASPERFIDRVEFYIDNDLLGVASNPPFSVLWSLQDLSGRKRIKALAYRAYPNTEQSADSITVSLEGVFPIPKLWQKLE